MIDYINGAYDFEDSINVPRFLSKPTIVDTEQAANKAKNSTVSDEDEFDEIDYEMAMQLLGSRPSEYPKCIGAGDFAGMLADVRDNRTLEGKAEVLRLWAEFYHGTLGDFMRELADAILEGDNDEVRRLIAKICA